MVVQVEDAPAAEVADPVLTRSLALTPDLARSDLTGGGR